MINTFFFSLRNNIYDRLEYFSYSFRWCWCFLKHALFGVNIWICGWQKKNFRRIFNNFSVDRMNLLIIIVSNKLISWGFILWRKVDFVCLLKLFIMYRGNLFSMNFHSTSCTYLLVILIYSKPTYSNIFATVR